MKSKATRVLLSASLLGTLEHTIQATEVEQPDVPVNIQDEGPFGGAEVIEATSTTTEEPSILSDFAAKVNAYQVARGSHKITSIQDTQRQKQLLEECNAITGQKVSLRFVVKDVKELRDMDFLMYIGPPLLSPYARRPDLARRGVGESMAVATLHGRIIKQEYGYAPGAGLFFDISSQDGFRTELGPKPLGQTMELRVVTLNELAGTLEIGQEVEIEGRLCFADALFRVGDVLGPDYSWKRDRGR